MKGVKRGRHGFIVRLDDGVNNEDEDEGLDAWEPQIEPLYFDDMGVGDTLLSNHNINIIHSQQQQQQPSIVDGGNVISSVVMCVFCIFPLFTLM